MPVTGVPPAPSGEEDPEDNVDFRVLYTKLLQQEHYAPAPVQVLPEGGLTSEWVRASGLQDPTLIEQGNPNPYATYFGPLLGQQLQDLQRLAQELGEDREAHTLDVVKQAPGPKWNMRQWCLYWRDRETVPPPDGATAQRSTHLPNGRHQVSDAVARITAATSQQDGAEHHETEDEADSAFVHQGDVDQFRETNAPRKGIRDANKRRLIALTYLPIADHPGAAAGAPVPAPLKEADLLERPGMQSAQGLQQVPASLSQRHHLTICPAGTFFNFKLAPSGCLTWYHVVHGRLVLALIPPTEENLALYASWVHSGARERGYYLAASCSGVVRLEVAAGQSALLPSGWPFALVATADTLAVGSQMLHVHALGAALRSWDVEDLLKVKVQARFPSFRVIMWYAAMSYMRVLRTAAGLPALKKQLPAASRGEPGPGSAPVSMSGMQHHAGGGAGTQRRAAPQAQDSVNNLRAVPERSTLIGNKRLLDDQVADSPRRPVISGIGAPSAAGGQGKPPITSGAKRARSGAAWQQTPSQALRAAATPTGEAAWAAPSASGGGGTAAYTSRAKAQQVSATGARLGPYARDAIGDDASSSGSDADMGGSGMGGMEYGAECAGASHAAGAATQRPRRAAAPTSVVRSALARRRELDSALDTSPPALNLDAAPTTGGRTTRRSSAAAAAAAPGAGTPSASVGGRPRRRAAAAAHEAWQHLVTGSPQDDGDQGALAQRWQHLDHGQESSHGTAQNARDAVSDGASEGSTPLLLASGGRHGRTGGHSVARRGTGHQRQQELHTARRRSGPGVAPDTASGGHGNAPDLALSSGGEEGEAHAGSGLGRIVRRVRQRGRSRVYDDDNISQDMFADAGKGVDGGSDADGGSHGSHRLTASEQRSGSAAAAQQRRLRGQTQAQGSAGGGHNGSIAQDAASPSADGGRHSALGGSHEDSQAQAPRQQQLQQQEARPASVSAMARLGAPLPPLAAAAPGATAQAMGTHLRIKLPALARIQQHHSAASGPQPAGSSSPAQRPQQPVSQQPPANQHAAAAALNHQEYTSPAIGGDASNAVVPASAAMVAGGKGHLKIKLKRSIPVPADAPAQQQSADSHGDVIPQADGACDDAEEQDAAAAGSADGAGAHDAEMTDVQQLHQQAHGAQLQATLALRGHGSLVGSFGAWLGTAMPGSGGAQAQAAAAASLQAILRQQQQVTSASGQQQQREDEVLTDGDVDSALDLQMPPALAVPPPQQEQRGGPVAHAAVPAPAEQHEHSTPVAMSHAPAPIAALEGAPETAQSSPNAATSVDLDLGLDLEIPPSLQPSTAPAAAHETDMAGAQAPPAQPLGSVGAAPAGAPGGSGFNPFAAAAVAAAPADDLVDVLGLELPPTVSLQLPGAAVAHAHGQQAGDAGAAGAPAAAAAAGEAPSPMTALRGTKRPNNPIGHATQLRGNPSASFAHKPRVQPIKSISMAVPSADKALGLVAIGANRAAQLQQGPKGSLSKMLPSKAPGRPTGSLLGMLPSASAAPPPGSLRAAALASSRAALGEVGSPGATPSGARLGMQHEEQAGPLLPAAGASQRAGPNASASVATGPHTAAGLGVQPVLLPDTEQPSVGAPEPSTGNAAAQGLTQLSVVAGAIEAALPGHMAVAQHTSDQPMPFSAVAGSHAHVPPTATAAMCPPPPPVPPHQVLAVAAPAASQDLQAATVLGTAATTTAAAAATSMPPPPPPAAPTLSSTTPPCAALNLPPPSAANAPGPAGSLASAPTPPTPAGPKPPSLSKLLSAWEIRDIPLLVSALRRGLHESNAWPDDVPQPIKDPEHALEQLEDVLFALEHPAYPGITAAAAAGSALGDAGAVAPSSLLPPPPPALPLPPPRGSMGPPSTTPRAGSSQGLRLALTGDVRFAVPGEMPESWRRLLARQAAVANMAGYTQSQGPGSTLVGAAETMDTVEETAETDPHGASEMGGRHGRLHGTGKFPGTGRSRQLSKKVEKLKKGLGL